MQDSTTVKPHIMERQAYLQREVAEISAIYRRCFPGHALQLVVEEGDDPARTEPVVLDAGQAVQPQHLQYHCSPCFSNSFCNAATPPWAVRPRLSTNKLPWRAR